MPDPQHQFNRRILVIDDNPAIQDDFRKILGCPRSPSAQFDKLEAALFPERRVEIALSEYEVVSAFQGQEGFVAVQRALAEGRPFALAFVDVRMPPGWDGIETTAKIWGIDPNLQVVLCTAYSDYSWEEMATQLGCSDRLLILKKPFDNVEVLQLASTLTEKWRLQRQTRYHLNDLEEAVRHRTEELARSEARFHKLTAFSPLVVFESDPQGQWTYVNPRWTSISGQLADQSLGTGWTEAVHPEDRALVVEAWRQAVAAGRSCVQEFRLLAPSQEVRWVACHASPIEASGKRCRGYVGTMEDSTERRKVEEQLRKLSRAVEQSSTSIVITDLAGNIEYVNAKFCEITGYTAAEVLGHNPRFLKSGRQSRETYQQLWATITAGQEWRGELQNRKKSGELYWELVIISPIRNATGTVTHYVAIKEDITERKGTEAALQESKSLLEQAQAMAHLGSWSSGERLDGPLVWSPGVYRIFGLDPTKFDGTVSAFLEQVHPEDRAQVEAAARAVREQGSPYHIEHRIVRPDGTVRWVREQAEAIRNGQDRMVRLLGVVQDITERKHADLVQAAVYQLSEAAHSAQDLNALFHVIHTIIGELMPARNFLIAMCDGKNNAIHFPYYVDEFDPAPARRERGHGFTDYVLRTGQALLATPEVWQSLQRAGELEVMGTAPVDWLGVPLRAQNGQTIGVMAVQTYSESVRLKQADSGVLQFISTQVTMVIERKRAEEQLHRLNAELEQHVVLRTAQLQAANAELEAFSYSVSHDLRTPLRAIDGFARILVEDYSERLDAEGRHLVDVVCREAGRMGQLIDELLEFARLGRREINWTEFDMGAQAREVFAELRAQESERPIQGQFHALPPIYGDEAMLRLVWTNLLSNAFKYTRPRQPAVIEIGSQATPTEVIYYVKDNGVGFDPRYTTKLFHVFQRLHRDDEFEGTGVGLALVQRIVQRHAGRAWAESKLNEGATFYFSLPRRTHSP